jgi:hypothetical protein
MNSYRKHSTRYGHTSFRTVAEWLAKRADFSNSNKSFRGIACPDGMIGFWTHGQLPGDELAAMKLRAEGITYVVYSYQTPIAYLWCDQWYVPDVHYSATTTTHQSVVRTAVSVIADYSATQSVAA